MSVQPNNHCGNLDFATKFLNEILQKLEVSKKNPNALVQAWLLSAVIEKTRTVSILITNKWHGGVLEVCRSQMEAAADLLLLLRDDEHMKFLLQRQNKTIASFSEQAKRRPVAMPGVAATMKLEPHRKAVKSATQSIKSKLSDQHNQPIVDSVALAGLEEDFYRYLCSFTHNNLNTLKIRYADSIPAGGGLGSLTDDLLKSVVSQLCSSALKILDAFAERKKRLNLQ